MPIITCPAIPAWPPITTLSPIIALPAIPVWAAIIASLPIRTLWAIWTRLSINEFFEIIVDSKTALSIVEFDPMLQLSPIITLPMWLIRTFDFGSNPKPVPPITAPDLTIQLEPIIQSCKLELEFIIEFVPIIHSGQFYNLN